MGQLYSAPGCMAVTFPERDSKKFYTMAAHYVVCPCPCNKMESGTGLCNACQHEGVMTRGQVYRRARMGKTPNYAAHLLHKKCNH